MRYKEKLIELYNHYKEQFKRWDIEFIRMITPGMKQIENKLKQIINRMDLDFKVRVGSLKQDTIYEVFLDWDNDKFLKNPKDKTRMKLIGLKSFKVNVDLVDSPIGKSYRLIVYWAHSTPSRNIITRGDYKKEIIDDANITQQRLKQLSNKIIKEFNDWLNKMERY